MLENEVIKRTYGAIRPTKFTAMGIAYYCKPITGALKCDDTDDTASSSCHPERDLSIASHKLEIH